MAFELLEVRLAGREFLLDPAGALFWPERRMLVVADLHLGKAEALARRGLLAPPYEFGATLARLESVIARHRPQLVASLGDGFHDGRAARGLEGEAFDRLAALVRRQEWLWITGNHDPTIPLALGGAVLDRLVLDGLSFVHVPTGAEGEIAGHLHPAARIATAAGRIQRRRCFAADGARLLLPAAGTLAGGLNVLDPAIAGLFPAGFTAYLLATDRLFPIPARRLLPDLDPRRHRLPLERSSSAPEA
ncbi:MAG: ligase-associated DNA damage response endonuclease PdeM [Geminicoccaceae bacterium]|nr:ligase-associated DNA damage response endonuclease PdeM [Geminicoccaceae bacterium]MCX8099842.1 ligase-associated DNA damage response endonuclease PdeM [Geminicoccaceae bacterium]MDW8369744.1 ligase-associated DNA damage response endonuclease PdeM [Geminicoccaceae bacterium]